MYNSQIKNPNHFRFQLDLAEYGAVQEKQELIAQLRYGNRVSIQYKPSIRSGNGRLEVYIKTYRIGIVPQEYFSAFFKDGILQDSRCSVTGLLPCGKYILTCEIEAFLSAPQAEVKKQAEKQEPVCMASPIKLPPKRNLPGTKKKPRKIPISCKNIRMPLFRREWFIFLMCLLLPPVGIALLWFFSRRHFPGKLSLTCISVFIVFTLCFSLIAVEKNRSQIKFVNSPENTVTEFVACSREENWPGLTELIHPENNIPADEELKNMFENRLTGNYTIRELSQNNNDRKTYLLEGENWQVTIDTILHGTRWFVDISSLSHDFFDEPLSELLKKPGDIQTPNDEATVYLEQNNLIYHKNKGCAPEHAPQNSLSEAIAKDYSPCPKCAR